MADSQTIFDLGVEAAREGDREQAHNLFRLLTNQEPDSLQAWLWLAGTSEGAERQAALERALEIEPTNEMAIKELERMGVRAANNGTDAADATLPTASQSPNNPKCPVCGTPNHPANRFCDQCGSRLEAQATALSSTEALAAQPIAAATCPSCGAAVLPGEAFCDECGASLYVPTCPSCGAAVLPGEAFCDECGADMLASRAAPVVYPPPISSDAPYPRPTGAQGPICPACGERNLPGDRFCDNCGADMLAELAATDTPTTNRDASITQSNQDLLKALIATPPLAATKTQAPPQAQNVDTSRRAELESEITRQQQIIDQFEQMQALLGAAAPRAVVQGLNDARDIKARAEAELEALQPSQPPDDPSGATQPEDIQPSTEGSASPSAPESVAVSEGSASSPVGEPIAAPEPVAVTEGHTSPPAPEPTSVSEMEVSQPPALAMLPNTPLREIILQKIITPALRESLPAHVLDIHITPGIASYVAELSSDQPKPFERMYQVFLTFQEQCEDGRQKRCYVEGPLQLDHSASHDQQDGSLFGAMLHSAIFHNDCLDNRQRLLQQEPGHRTLLGAYRHALSQMDEQTGLRIQLRISNQASELHSYRWEYLWDPEGEVALACSNKISFARTLHTGSIPPPPPTISRQQPLRVLAALASPHELDAPSESHHHDELRGLAPIDASQITTLKLGLERLNLPIEPLTDGNLLASPRDYVSRELLRQTLVKAVEQDRRPVRVLHLICHGIMRASGGKKCLVLHRPNSPSFDLVSDDDLAQTLSEFKDTLRLVVLASCFTALPSNDQPLQGIARRLVAVGIPAVIAMQDALQFEAAQFFTQRLYSHLALHGEIDRAVNAARRELLDRGPRKARDRDSKVWARQWGVPVLFTSLCETPLFIVDKSVAASANAHAALSAIPYAQAPDRNPERLAQGMLHGLAGQLGLQINLAVPNLTVALSKAIVEAPTASTPVAASNRLFHTPTQRHQRERLVRAVLSHRLHPARRVVLRLREKALDHIADLVQNKRNKLKATFAKSIWDGGYLRLDGRPIDDILEGGPSEGVFIGEKDNSLDLTWSRVQAHLPRRPVGADEQSDGFVGNLTWRRHEQLPDGGCPSAAELKRLLDEQQSDIYAQFRDLTTAGRKSLGLDERTASLILHAVYRDRYVPYCRDLAERVIDLLEVRHHERYDDGFRGFCELAHCLHMDRELEFESLTDVGYFLQRLAAQRIQLDNAPDIDDEIDSDKSRPVDLRAGEIYSQLTTDPRVIDQGVAALNAGKHIIFSGPPGTGKTTLAEELCQHGREFGFNRGHLLTTATADWTTFDTIGGYIPEAGDRLVFRPGIFLEAIEANKWLIIDEINRADIDKAFGQLFTVLSGQTVVLPYKDELGRVVRILPPRKHPSRETRDFVIHERWRIIGTMNVYDKASLFAMSYAFMRRFAFVEVPIPKPHQYKQLLHDFFKHYELPTDQDDVFVTLCSVLEQRDDNPLMCSRALGPAIAQDIVRYLHSRTRTSTTAFNKGFLAEALELYVMPQLEGLDQKQIRDVYDQFKKLFADGDARHRERLLAQIVTMFPHYRFYSGEQKD